MSDIVVVEVGGEVCAECHVDGVAGVAGILACGEGEGCGVTGEQGLNLRGQAGFLESCGKMRG